MIDEAPVTWKRCGDRLQFAAGTTRQTLLPTSSATSSAPPLSIATPTGRPSALSSSLRNPVRMSCGRAGRLAVRERHEDHLVAAARLAVPRAMLADEGAVLHFGAEQVAGVEGQAERRGMRAERIVRHDRLCDEVGPRRLRPHIDMLAVIAVGPAIEAAVLDGGHVVGNEVAADLVALVDDDPKLAALRVPGQAVRVAQARCEKARLLCCEIDLKHGCAVLFLLHAVFADIAVGADCGVELGAVRAGDDVLGPMMVVGRPEGRRSSRPAR